LVDVHLAGNDVQVVTALADHLEQGAA
jgi:hypothetical protein